MIKNRPDPEHRQPWGAFVENEADGLRASSRATFLHVNQHENIRYLLCL